MPKLIDRLLALMGLGRTKDIQEWTKLMRARVRLLIEQRDTFEEQAYDLHFRCEHAKDAMKAEHASEVSAMQLLHGDVIERIRTQFTASVMGLNAELIKRGLEKQAMDERAAIQLEMDEHRADLERELADARVSNDRAQLRCLEAEKNYAQSRQDYHHMRKKADMLEAREESWKKLHEEVVRERNAISAAMTASLKNSLKNTANT